MIRMSKVLTGIFLLAFCIFMAGSAFAAPYLVCDPQTNVTSYIVTLDGTETEVPAQDLGNGTVRLHFDLASVTEGEHHVEVRAKNIWGVSDPVPFDFTKTLPALPSGFSISTE